MSNSDAGFGLSLQLDVCRSLYVFVTCCLQCFDTVGRMSHRMGIQPVKRLEWWYVWCWWFVWSFM